jgi:hypothetical protein
MIMINQFSGYSWIVFADVKYDWEQQFDF